MSTLSRRKRRQSWESGTSDGSRATKTPRASFDSSEFPTQPQLQPPVQMRNHVHAGDLKMRIHVPQPQANSIQQNGASSNLSKQKKSTSGGQSETTSNLKNVRKLAQRPSISSVSILVQSTVIQTRQNCTCIRNSEI